MQRCYNCQREFDSTKSEVPWGKTSLQKHYKTYLCSNNCIAKYKKQLKWEKTFEQIKKVRETISLLQELVPEAFETKKALEDLLKFKPEYTDMEQFKKNGYYDTGDEKAPFFSESYLYNLIGKEDARTLLGLLNSLLKSLGSKEMV